MTAVSKAKQPSKRQREMAARYCDARSAWLNGLCGYGPGADEPAYRLATRILYTVIVEEKEKERNLAVTWAEAAAWLRSGEDLP